MKKNAGGETLDTTGTFPGPSRPREARVALGATRAHTWKVCNRGATTRCEVNRDGRRRERKCSSSVEYKVVESSEVTDEAIERILNEWTAQGWTFDGMQFAMRESSKRPAMVFVLFTRKV